MIPITFGDQAEEIFGDREAVHPLSVDAWKIAISMKVADSPQTRERLTAKIRKYEPDYAPPEPQPQGGCYVATCVYGSYDCPQVWTLRRFRDDMLAESRPGRAFIRAYYAVSPTLVKWFGETRWFRALWRGRLDRLVASLRRRGVADTPYRDRDW